jgi:CRISPR-associated protein Cmr1
MVRNKLKNSTPPHVKTWDENKQELEPTHSGKEEPGSASTTETGSIYLIGNTEVVVQTRQYRLITPLFGGGVEPGVNDLDNLIRATEIRGQLRFWWRAIRGWQCNDRKELKELDDKIWGAASKTPTRNEDQLQKSAEVARKTWQPAIQIEVNVTEPGRGIEPFQIVEKDNPKKPGAKIYDAKPNDSKQMGYEVFPAYAAFPLKPPREELQAAKKKEDVVLKTIQRDVAFTLKIAFPKQWEDEVEAALWAWETFGGIGARTRRGFGAIQRKESEQYDPIPTNRRDAEIWIKNKLTSWGADQPFPKDIPHLSPTMQLCFLKSIGEPVYIWNALINKLQKYRQQRDSLKDKRTGKPKSGPNKWPEAEAIRNRTPGQSVKGQNQPVDKFPRAAFGLPIVFHFIKEPNVDNTTLQGSDLQQDRLASPLLLRPLGCDEDQALGLAAVLEGWSLPSRGLQLMLKRGSPKAITPLQTRLDANEVTSLQLKGITGKEKDTLQAFMDHFKKEEK